MLLGVLLLGACAARLPTYPAMTDEDTLRLIAARLDAVTSVSASADLLLTNAKGETVSLDGAFVATPPQRARLRAWKFGSPVLDLTILPEGVYAFAAQHDESRSESGSDLTTLPSAGVSRALELMTGTYFLHATSLPAESTAATLVVVGPALGQDSVRCEIDRATLTPRWFRIGTTGAQGQARTMTLFLDRYTLVRIEGGGGVAWARRLRFTSPEGEIELRLSDVELNGEIGAKAFVPPARAARIP
jgi:hypothetical protein